MIYQVNEVYRTIQGEGWHAGLPVTLVRFQGCVQECEFCDTKYAQDPKGGIGATTSQLYALIEKIHAREQIILLTGGEPAIQDLWPIVKFIRDLGPIHLETSGAYYIKSNVRSALSWVTVSPKELSCDYDTINNANEIKWVVKDQDDIDALREYLVDSLGLRFNVKVCVQPISRAARATEVCLKACLKFGWRLSLQTHKYIGVK